MNYASSQAIDQAAKHDGDAPCQCEQEIYQPSLSSGEMRCSTCDEMIWEVDQLHLLRDCVKAIAARQMRRESP